MGCDDNQPQPWNGDTSNKILPLILTLYLSRCSGTQEDYDVSLCLMIHTPWPISHFWSHLLTHNEIIFIVSLSHYLIYWHICAVFSVVVHPSSHLHSCPPPWEGGAWRRFFWFGASRCLSGNWVCKGQSWKVGWNGIHRSAGTGRPFQMCDSQNTFISRVRPSTMYPHGCRLEDFEFTWTAYEICLTKPIHPELEPTYII